MPGYESTMFDTIQDALDDLTSIRSSLSRKGRALNTLERLIADIYVPSSPSAILALKTFISLQETFQCNIPSRLLLWISETSSRLDSLIGEGSIEPDRHSEVSTLSAQLGQAFSIIQGIVLSHEGSKRYLGRRRALEILVHVFIVARRVPPKSLTPRSVSTPASTDSKKDKDALPVSLSSTILDTLSCILVDSSPAMRAFEDVNGVKAVVKILKRQGTTREVKIKCMEFLYFYVNAENPTWTCPSDSEQERSRDSDMTLVPTAPNSPTGRRPSHRPAMPLSQSSDSSSSSVSSAKTPARRPSKTLLTSKSYPASPEQNIPPTPKHSVLEQIEEDNVTATPRKASAGSIKYPKTPRKALQPLNIASRRPSPSSDAPSLETPAQRRQDRLVLGRSVTPNAFTRGHRRAQSSCDVLMSSPASPPPLSSPANIVSKDGSSCGSVATRSMEEKKEILRGMMSNADALLEGMNKVGIWGLA